ncbi:MAG TPA: UDP-N-acetylmuramoyl-L-alanine--D-glutamate ligase [Bacteroidia bacterium]|nr:UDP-N-acetylmuramoyl-L-alanine--D-glutamate ligase [Bacteroidia bacterium]HRH07971.1 UDP-N-acetylmuramoyl-L-alanine--D-glutamate ligase [Bacteroidia bacterium]HRH63661.1 UDP-N-acetylmuramoyl-L-alanine--D-glutamate ligase [Bacteroidia bacterium]
MKTTSNKKRLVVLGAGESGVGTAVLGVKMGFDVFVSDQGSIKEKYKKELLSHQIEFEENQHTSKRILTADEVVKSPGIPDKAELVQALLKKGKPVLSEIEFAARYTHATLIGITGTNGKTTTTLLTYHILTKAGLNVGLAGNVGKSFARQVAESNFDYYVLELSSFQLDGMFKTRINLAVLLNITPDHLDRYEYELQNYVDSKFRITQNQLQQDVFIYCKDDAIIQSNLASQKITAQLIPISIYEKVENGAYLNETELILDINNKPFSMSIHSLALQGKHNIYNSMAAGIVAKVLDIRNEIVRESLADFENIEHRLEFVTKVHGIEFINDSKATNVNSTWYALESMTNPTVWIVGGVDKGNDYSMLRELVKDKVKAIVCLGKENEKIHNAFADLVEIIVDAHSSEEAVKRSYKLAKKGDTVLLSPACSSFDLFENYEDRGRQFKRDVKSL